MFGGIGGLVEFRASLLAAHGFAVLALAYFAYEDLPKHLADVDLEYFEEAANLLLAHPKVLKNFTLQHYSKRQKESQTSILPILPVCLDFLHFTVKMGMLILAL